MVATQALNHFGQLKLSLAISQDTTISILAPAVIAVALVANGPPEAKVAAALTVIGASAITTGFTFWCIGRLGLGRIVRMFPYSMAAGFLASSGYPLVFSALYILTEQTSFSAVAQAAADPHVQLRLAPAILMAVTMTVAMRVWSGSSAVLVIIFVLLAGFYATIFAIGLDSAAAVDMGFLPRVDSARDGHLSLSMFGMIDWWALLGAVPIILAVVLLNFIGMLLNTSGVELATNADVDENRELMVTGKANIIIVAFEGLTSYLQGGATIVAAKLGLQQWPMILGHNVALLLACAFAPLMVSVIPSFVPAALLMFIGLSMLEDWLVRTWRRLQLLNWLIVLSIVLATAFIGVMPAICIGIGMALAGFTYALIRLPIIRQSASAAKRRSIRDRSTLQSEALLGKGHRIRILQLHGPLFLAHLNKSPRVCAR